MVCSLRSRGWHAAAADAWRWADLSGRDQLPHCRWKPRMCRFRTVLVPGTKQPYRSWTFLIIPADVAMQWGPGQKAVRGSVNGHKFQGTASRGEGALRVPIPRDFRQETGLGCGDTVDVVLDLDMSSRLVHVPVELQAVFNDQPDIATLFDELPPSLRRAWATYVAEAKQAETRRRRAERAPEGIRARAFPR